MIFFHLRRNPLGIINASHSCAFPGRPMTLGGSELSYGNMFIASLDYVIEAQVESADFYTQSARATGDRIHFTAWSIY